MGDSKVSSAGRPDKNYLLMRYYRDILSIYKLMEECRYVV